jgi:hypothetical protein
VGFAPVVNPALVVLVTVHNTSGENGQGADAAAPVFSAIMTEALRMLDVPHDIPEQEIATNAKPSKKDKFDDVSIADLGGTSIMEDDPSVKQLLAEQAQIIPTNASTAEIPQGTTPPPPAPLLALATPGTPRNTPAPAQPATVVTKVAEGPLVPDFRGKSMRDAMETASADSIEVMVEGSGVARAQVPLPGTPLHQGEKIRIIFTR